MGWMSEWGVVQNHESWQSSVNWLFVVDIQSWSFWQVSTSFFRGMPPGELLVFLVSFSHLAYPIVKHTLHSCCHWLSSKIFLIWNEMTVQQMISGHRLWRFPRHEAERSTKNLIKGLVSCYGLDGYSLSLHWNHLAWHSVFVESLE